MEDSACRMESGTLVEGRVFLDTKCPIVSRNLSKRVNTEIYFLL